MSHLTIYRASAGAGKTFTLVKEYLKIVLVNPWDYRHILAITFTNKATEEMKSRIMDTLAVMASASAEQIREMPMYQDIKQHLLLKQKADPETVIKNARTTLHRILADYSNFSVSTIESFFQKIIRAFSRELDVPLGYEIDMRQDVVLDEIIQRSLKQAGKEAEITALLGQFLERNLADEKGWRIEAGIRKLGRQLFTERFQAELIDDKTSYAQRREDILELEKALRALIAKTDNYLLSLAKEALQAIEMAGLEISDFAYGKSGPAGQFVKIIEKKDYEFGKRAQKAAKEGIGWVSKKGSPLALSLAEETLNDILLQIHDFWEGNKRRYESAKIILSHLLEFALLFDLQERLVSYREDKSLLVISDTNLLLKQVIGDQETPFVYEKVGNRYHYFLIDEFQDTSDMQWANLLPLLTNVLAQSYHSLLVGDVKQSIFRWRNGNPELLLYQAGYEIQQKGAAVKLQSLQSNWRTAPQIVSFNNRFFTLLSNYFAEERNETGKRYLQDAYADVAQEPERNATGFVSVESFAKRVEKEKLDWEQTALDRTLTIIRDAVADGFALNDIVMLVRTNREGSQLASWLQQHNYKVASPDALEIGNDEQVQFLIAALRWLEEPQEKLFRANLAWFARNMEVPKVSPHAYFAQSETHIPEALKTHAALLRRMAVLPCLERICQFFPQLQTPNAFVSALMEQALEISSAQNTSLSGFLAHWDEEGHRQKVAVGDTASSLQLMTIHKAKGLEFPIVIVPFADWGIQPKNSTTLWVSSMRKPFDKIPYYPIAYSNQLAQSYFEPAWEEESLKSHLDNINLLYVAFTRPKYRLYVITFHQKTNPSNRLAKSLLSVVQQLEPESSEETAYYQGYSWGSAVPAASVVKGEEPSEIDVHELATNPDPLLPWEGAVRIRLAVGRFLRADRIAQEAAASAGTLLHEALARVKTLDDIPLAVAQLVAGGLLAIQESEAFATILHSTLDHPELKRWFTGDWEVRNEMSILRPDGSVLRPDRVVMRGNEVVIIDYKTGKQRDSHEAQIAAYMDAMREILPDAEVSGYLYYTDRKALV
jgi:ATP-dependent exoDNAse (exonuclease V) beta subunit